MTPGAVVTLALCVLAAIAVAALAVGAVMFVAFRAEARRDLAERGGDFLARRGRG